MDNIVLVYVVAAALLVLLPVVFCAAQRPRLPFFAGTIVGAVLGNIMGVLLTTTGMFAADKMGLIFLSQMDYAAVVVVLAGAFGGGIIGAWAGIIVAARRLASRAVRRCGLPFFVGPVGGGVPGSMIGAILASAGMLPLDQALLRMPVGAVVAIMTAGAFGGALVGVIIGLVRARRRPASHEVG
jgi:hypothetical protein